MPFDNLSGIKTKKFNLGLFILLTFLALAASLLIPGLGLLGAALLPVPASLLFIKKRVRDGIICAGVSCLVLFLFGYILPPVIMALIIAAAFSHKYAVEKKWPAWKTIGAVFAAFAGAVVLYLVLYVLFYGPGALSGISGAYNSYIDSMGEDPLFSSYARLMMIDRTDLDAVISQTQSVMRFLPRILPGILAVSFGVVSLANYLFSANIYRRNQIYIKPFKPFIAWDLPWYYVWGIIIGLILVLIPEMGETVDGSKALADQAADVIGFNLVIVFGFLYAVLGISVLWGIFARFRLGLLARVVIIAILWFFFAAALFVFPLLGLIDIWANFRRLKRDQ
jgi:uncharacterized protein YybS (DUF2232 family)